MEIVYRRTTTMARISICKKKSIVTISWEIEVTLGNVVIKGHLSNMTIAPFITNQDIGL